MLTAMHAGVVLSGLWGERRGGGSKPAVFEHEHRWNALHLILGCQGRALVQVNLYELYTP